MKNTTFNTQNYRLNDIAHNLAKARFTPLDVMVTGVTGAGKSTTLNALFNKEVAEVGTGTDPMTMTLDSYDLHGTLRFWDTPGLGDGIAQDTLHSKKMIELLHKTYQLEGQTYGWIDMVIIVIEGSNRDMGTTIQLIQDVLLSNIDPDRVIVAINKADLAQKGRNWNVLGNVPNEKLQLFLNQQADSIQSRIKTSCGLNLPRPIFYSAENNYNTRGFMDAIIDAMPETRRNLILKST